MNVTLFGLDDTAVINLASKLAQHYNVKFLNASKAFSTYLMSNDKKGSYNLEELEKSFMKELSALNNVVISLPQDMFISNNNFKLLKKSLKIHVEFKSNIDIVENLDNLLIKYADISLPSENFLTNIIKVLKDKYDI